MTLLTLKRQPHKMVKHTQTIHRLLPKNCLSVFDHFVGLVLKGLIINGNEVTIRKQIRSCDFTLSLQLSISPLAVSVKYHY